VLKSELITNAFQELRIWGVTTASDPEDTGLALRKLESMMAELESQKDLCIGYNYTENPDPNDESGVGIEHQEWVQNNLAVRMIAAYNKQVPPELRLSAATGLSGAIGQSLKSRMSDIAPPSRMPRGSGSRLAGARYRRFNPAPIEAAGTCDTKRMKVNDVNDFDESFAAYLAGETIASYTITSTDGLTVSNDSNTDDVVSYRVTAAGTVSALEKVTIIVTTSTSRINTRVIQFEVS